MNSFKERIASLDGYYETKKLVNARKKSVAKASRKRARPLSGTIGLARRVPVHVRIDNVPPDVRLVAGITATVRISRLHRWMSQ